MRAGELSLEQAVDRACEVALIATTLTAQGRPELVALKTAVALAYEVESADGLDAAVVESALAFWFAVNFVGDTTRRTPAQVVAELKSMLRPEGD